MKKTILLVEDQAIIAVNEARIIERHGYTVQTVYSGEQAVALFQESADISMVLMDIDLGKGMDGLATAQKILQLREVPIVFLTGHAEKEMVDKVKDITRYGYILKNSGEFVLIEGINMAFELFDAHLKIKRENEERKTSEKKYTDLFEYSPIVLWEEDFSTVADYLKSLRKEGIKDIKRYLDEHPEEIWRCASLINVIDVNRATFDLLGLSSKDEAIGSLSSTFTESALGVLKNELSAIWDGKSFVKENGTVQLPSGDVRQVIIQWQDLPGYGQEYSEVIVSFLDVTDLRNHQKQLERQELQSRQLFQQAGIGIILSNPSHEIVAANPYALELLGYTEEEICTLTAKDLVHPEDQKYRSIDQNLQQMLAQNQRVEVERKYKKKSGEYIDVLISMNRLDDFSEDISHMLMFSDITERKKTEQQIQELLEEKKILLKEVYHRVKKDLHLITSLLSLQAASVEDEKAAQPLEEARHRIALMQNLYETLYHEERFDSLNIRFYLQGITDNIRGSFEHNAGFRFDTSFADIEIPHKQAFPIGIILNELITNVQKYAFQNDKPAVLKVSVSVNDENYAVIKVQDNGRGMPAHVVHERSYGFGLSLVDTLARQNAGSLHIESNRQRGTSITVTLQILDCSSD
ncbi:MAG: PAS domain S-box protein [Spirochaetota bacterium]|nr:PAS domain S-box protein [Spirochaetota bacterium]